MGLARMQGKSVVVSGAAFGIGRATAAKFAEEGASLLVQDIQERPLLEFRDELQGQNRQATYGPAKFLATGITKHLAIEWADRGIRVNAVAPGTINTERVKRLPEEPGGSEYMEAIKKAHPMGRLGEPEEVANAILFLASDEASFITGKSMAGTWLSKPRQPQTQARAQMARDKLKARAAPEPYSLLYLRRAVAVRLQ